MAMCGLLILISHVLQLAALARFSFAQQSERANNRAFSIQHSACVDCDIVFEVFEQSEHFDRLRPLG